MNEDFGHLPISVAMTRINVRVVARAEPDNAAAVAHQSGAPRRFI
jgi:hypothetical protein